MTAEAAIVVERSGRWPRWSWECAWRLTSSAEVVHRGLAWTRRGASRAAERDSKAGYR